jgi:hypothetical protein
MATTHKTGAKGASVEAILHALQDHPEATVAELADLARIGRSTASRTLANLETDARVTRERGRIEAKGRTTSDRWTLVPATPADPPAEAEQQPAAEQAATEPADTSVPASQDDEHAGQDAPPSSAAADTASTETGATTTDTAEPTSGKDSSQRLRPGALRAQVRAWLAERPG